MTCGYQFRGGNRISPEQLWEEYVNGKQTYAQLASKYKCSIKTIQRKLDTVHIALDNQYPSVVNLLMDTTYFNRHSGVMVFKDSLTGKYLHKIYVRSETIAAYKEGVAFIKAKGIYIQSIICDGRRGLLTSFADIPIQMCQFHQQQIIVRYLTQKPRLQASIELKELASNLIHSSRLNFESALDLWHTKWETFLKERTLNPLTGRSHYTHKRVRSAWNSLKRHIPYLFTYKEFPELMIPNTTNALDGCFADLKKKLRNHNGLSPHRKRKFVDGFFKV